MKCMGSKHEQISTKSNKESTHHNFAPRGLPDIDRHCLDRFRLSFQSSKHNVCIGVGLSTPFLSYVKLVKDFGLGMLVINKTLQ